MPQKRTEEQVAKAEGEKEPKEVGEQQVTQEQMGNEVRRTRKESTMCRTQKRCHNEK